MSELKEEHFEVIDANKDRERQKNKYKPSSNEKGLSIALTPE